MARSTKRVDRLEERVGELPMSPEVLETSMAQFHASGVLPEHPKLAELVIQRTLHTPRHRPLREQLLHEAVHGMPEVSKAAREVLKLLVAAGQDVTSRGFLDESMEPSEYGPLGWQLLGWPEILIREPYAEQAKRLLARLDKVRESAAYKDQRWFEDFAAQSATFFQSGRPAGWRVRARGDAGLRRAARLGADSGRRGGPERACGVRRDGEEQWRGEGRNLSTVCASWQRTGASPEP
jgi:nucleotide-binding universal stress UspA family protein